MRSLLPEHDIVLLGMGHTNAHVLRMWRMEPLARTRLTCVSNFPVATYSGMLPGVLAGQYEPEEMKIDLVRLCAAAGARLILGEVVGLDRVRRELLLTDRPPVPYDALSIGIGSVPSDCPVAPGDPRILPIKPMQSFLHRVEQAVSRFQEEIGIGPLRVSVVGGGVGSVEVAFCLPAATKHREVEVTVICAESQLANGTSAGTARLAKELLEARGVNVLHERRVIKVSDGRLTLDNGEEFPSDLIIWATSAIAPPLLGKLGLPTDERGFLLTRPTLQTVADERLFAVGDAGTIIGNAVPKAGVYAVRQGPVLWENLQRFIRHTNPTRERGDTEQKRQRGPLDTNPTRQRGSPLLDYRPQSGFLKLINTGDSRAIGEYLGFTFSGRWVWRLKDRIDRKFMAMYQDYTPMAGGFEGEEDEDEHEAGRQMRCLGCGGKVGGGVLARVLARLEIPSHPSVPLGLATPDDVALIQQNGGQPLAVTTDFFAPPLDDPYLVGRMAALHAASDVFAKGARPIAALAIATIPPGSEAQQEQLLYDLLAGGLAEFRAMGATLAGGHTIESPQTMIGYTIVGQPQSRGAGVSPASVRTKAGLRPGDVLILTKPLGVGVLLAAHMQARLKAEWYEPLVAALLASNLSAADVLDDFDIPAATDVTGFGLAGHLLEMLRASRASAELELNRLPLLPGAVDLLASGLESTLAPANRRGASSIEVPESVADSAQVASLFDPQTCGGLLFGVRPAEVAPILDRLANTPTPGMTVGRILAAEDEPRLRVVRD